MLRLLGDLKDLGYVRDIFTKEEVKEKFHLDGEFSYMIEAAPNYAFGNAACGDLLAGRIRRTINILWLPMGTYRP